jgi:hypothetical protein
MIIEVPTVTSKVPKTHCKNDFHGRAAKNQSPKPLINLY